MVTVKNEKNNLLLLLFLFFNSFIFELEGRGGIGKKIVRLEGWME